MLKTIGTTSESQQMPLTGKRYTVEEIRKLRLKGAVYIRMSTELQTESPENQERQIRAYAEKYGIEIVKVYSDLGISGITAEHREQLQALLADVENGRNQFSIVLYLDESRWGRFVDSRKADFLRMRLEEKGIICQACDKEMTLDKGDVLERIITLFSDVNASAYSRQLSEKVFHGQCHLVEKGYRQGGVAGYGLRRMLLDETGKHKQTLTFKERKSLQTERVILVPGPEEEQANVRWIYDQFLGGVREAQIANLLNAKACKTHLGSPWSMGTVREVLTNEKYIGNNVYNRTSAKLKSKSKSNPIEEWIRKENAFTAVIDRARFDRAQAIIRERNKRLSDEALLARLKELYGQKGCLSAIIIDESEITPPSSLYKHRFGGLLPAYTLIGYVPERDYRYIEINRELRKLHSDIILKVIVDIVNLSGRVVSADQETGLIELNNNLFISLVMSRCFTLPSGGHRWKIRFDTGLHPDITIAVRMDSSNIDVYDYYYLPGLEFGCQNIKLSENNSGLLDSFRFENLNFLLSLSMNISIDEVKKYGRP
jgi:DNA invertase Pin-like site-specific DNA recombinase